MDTEKKKRGRPRKEVKAEYVTVAFPKPVHDRLKKYADANNKYVTAVAVEAAEAFLGIESLPVEVEE